MPRGDKSSHSPKQKRQAARTDKSYRKRGTSAKKAKSRAWATVNKRAGGAKKKKKTGSTAARRRR